MPPKRRFSARNSLYLRISASCVLQMVLYLDERHVFWMTEDTLERVLAALKDRIPRKLAAEIKSKKAKADVYRGAGYQMAYFFRKTPQKHAVLLKHKDMVTPCSDPSEPKPPPLPKPTLPLEGGTEEDPFDLDIPVDEQIHVKEEDDEAWPPSNPLFEPASPTTPEHTSDPMPEQGGASPVPLLDDTKPDVKPRLRVTYSGFTIFGRTLIVVIEPYPPLPANSPALTASATPQPDQRQLSATPVPARFGSTAPIAQPPLFREDTPSEAGDALRERARHLVEDDDDGELPDLGDEVFKVPSLVSRAASSDKRVGAGDGNVGMEAFARRKRAKKG